MNKNNYAVTLSCEEIKHIFFFFFWWKIKHILLLPKAFAVTSIPTLPIQLAGNELNSLQKAPHYLLSFKVFLRHLQLVVNILISPIRAGETNSNPSYIFSSLWEDDFKQIKGVEKFTFSKLHFIHINWVRAHLFFTKLVISRQNICNRIRKTIVWILEESGGCIRFGISFLKNRGRNKESSWSWLE